MHSLNGVLGRKGVGRDKKTVLNDMKRISSNPIRISKMTDNKLGYIPWNEQRSGRSDGNEDALSEVMKRINRKSSFMTENRPNFVYPIIYSIYLYFILK